jgi:hypothetical protein
MRTYSEGKYIYSVDMMIQYVNKFGDSKKIKINNTLLKQLDQKSWSTDNNPTSKKRISANDVLDNPEVYKSEFKKIKSANLKYPIIIHKKIIIDGLHRLAKCKFLDIDTINVYNIDSKTMKKFIIGKYPKYDQLYDSVLNELFKERFLKN